MYWSCPFQFTNGEASRVGRCGWPCRNFCAVSPIMYIQLLKLNTMFEFAIKKNTRKPRTRFSHYSEVGKGKVDRNMIEYSSHFQKSGYGLHQNYYNLANYTKTYLQRILLIFLKYKKLEYKPFYYHFEQNTIISNRLCDGTSIKLKSFCSCFYLLKFCSLLDFQII